MNGGSEPVILFYSRRNGVAQLLHDRASRVENHVTTLNVGSDVLAAGLLKYPDQRRHRQSTVSTNVDATK